MYFSSHTSIYFSFFFFLILHVVPILLLFFVSLAPPFEMKNARFGAHASLAEGHREPWPTGGMTRFTSHGPCGRSGHKEIMSSEFSSILLLL